MQEKNLSFQDHLNELRRTCDIYRETIRKVCETADPKFVENLRCLLEVVEASIPNLSSVDQVTYCNKLFVTEATIALSIMDSVHSQRQAAAEPDLWKKYKVKNDGSKKKEELLDLLDYAYNVVLTTMSDKLSDSKMVAKVGKIAVIHDELAIAMASSPYDEPLVDSHGDKLRELLSSLSAGEA